MHIGDAHIKEKSHRGRYRALGPSYWQCVYETDYTSSFVDVCSTLHDVQCTQQCTRYQHFLHLVSWIVRCHANQILYEFDYHSERINKKKEVCNHHILLPDGGTMTMNATNSVRLSCIKSVLVPGCITKM